jgi:hypothetical protein
MLYLANLRVPLVIAKRGNHLWQSHGVVVTGFPELSLEEIESFSSFLSPSPLALSLAPERW